MAGSILETFYILFQSDAEEVKEGSKEAQGASDKLEKQLKNTDKSAQKAGESFGSLAKRAVAALAPIVGLAALKSMAGNFAAGSLEAEHFARSAQVSMEAMQAWQGAAERVGGDASGLASSMKNLNDNMVAMRRFGGGEAAAVFYRLGVSIRDAEGKVKTADKMLLDLSGKFAGLSRERAMRLGEKLGLDEGTILLLQKGRKGVDDLLARQKELGLYSKRDAEESRKFSNALADMSQAFTSVAAIAMRGLLPILTGISEGITGAAGSVRKHKSLVTGFFLGLSVVMGVLALKTGLAFAPFLLMGAVILAVAAAFAILYDDIVNFMEGNDSLIGKISQKYPEVGECVRDIVAAFQMLWDIAKAVGTLLMESIENPQKAWENFKNTVGPIIDAFSERFPMLGRAIKDVGAIIEWLFSVAKPVFEALSYLSLKILGGIFDYISKIGGLLADAVHWVAELLGEDLAVEASGSVNIEPPKPSNIPKDGGAQLAAYKASMPNALPKDVEANLATGKTALAQTNVPLSAASGAALAGAREVNKTTSLHVDTLQVMTQATDAEGMAAGATDALTAQLRSAADNFDDGVAA